MITDEDAPTSAGSWTRVGEGQRFVPIVCVPLMVVLDLRDNLGGSGDMVVLV